MKEKFIKLFRNPNFSLGYVVAVFIGSLFHTAIGMALVMAYFITWAVIKHNEV